MSIITSVPKKQKNIFNDIRAPNSLFGGKDENNNARNPMIITRALKNIALPVCDIVLMTTFTLSISSREFTL
jgi:hypothetical protein